MFMLILHLLSSHCFYFCTIPYYLFSKTLARNGRFLFTLADVFNLHLGICIDFIVIQLLQRSPE